MKKLISVLTVLALILSVAFAETTGESKSVTYSFDSNSTTGYAWTGFVSGGDSVVLDSEEGLYVEDANPENLDGVGGETWFTLTPVQPGRSIVLFTYGRGWEADILEQRILLADVDELLNLFVSDITEASGIEGTVVSVDEDEHSILLNSEAHGEIIAYFDENVQLPVADEQVRLYTDGTMTMSLPAIVNVIAWATIPGEGAR